VCDQLAHCIDRQRRLIASTYGAASSFETIVAYALRVSKATFFECVGARDSVTLPASRCSRRALTALQYHRDRAACSGPIVDEQLCPPNVGELCANTRATVSMPPPEVSHEQRRVYADNCRDAVVVFAACAAAAATADTANASVLIVNSKSYSFMKDMVRMNLRSDYACATRRYAAGCTVLPALGGADYPQACAPDRAQPPGGGADIVARDLAQKLGEGLDSRSSSINRAGAAESSARACREVFSDGYTSCSASRQSHHQSHLAIAVAITVRLEDFERSVLPRESILLAVHPR